MEKKRETSSPGDWEMLVMTAAGPVVHALPSRGKIVIGRGKEADRVLDEPSMSRRHAAFEVVDAGVMVEDLGSANGTRLVTVVEDGPRTAERLDRKLTPHEPTLAPEHAALHLGSLVVLVRRRKQASRAVASADVIAESPAMVRALELVARVADSPLSVLFIGETGVGKDVMARALHAASPRRDGPFVAINCAALAEHLVESELFGHERGAFTGANNVKTGLLEAGAGGTVFLDEVGELPLTQQSKLLRALESREVTRVGALAPRPIDVRFVAATNRDPSKDADAGTFRKDLYFRLSGITIEVPPLRERSEDVEPLARAFARRAAEAIGAPNPELSPAALELLKRHPYPGNVRELRNTMDRAIALSRGGPVLPEHLLLATSEAPPPAPEVVAPASDDDERKRIVAALARCGGNQTRAAALLGISRRTLVTRLGKYGISRPRGGSADE